MVIEGIRREKAKQIEYVFRNWIDQIKIRENGGDLELYNIQFFGNCPFTLRYSNSNAIIIELGANYISLEPSDFVILTLF